MKNQNTWQFETPYQKNEGDNLIVKILFTAETACSQEISLNVLLQHEGRFHGFVKLFFLLYK